ncbi:MAG: toxin-antitoxin system, antitoxin component, Xre family protein [Gammaproteobacteria bacterium]|nr:toxin-antitoxin system, antitoxin component, Xre family protein [Gammaproteobacteria bacterium]
MQPQLKQVQEKLGQLTPDRLAEVDDFIDFLQQRDRERRLRHNYAQASEPSFAKLWDNDEDAVYDEL